MRYCALVFINLFFVLFVFGQSDSLSSTIDSDMHDTLKIEVLDKLTTENYGIDADLSIKYALQASDIARSINDQRRLGYALKNLGLGYYVKGEWVNVLQYWEESLEAFESINDTKGTSNLLSNIGAVYYNTGDYNEALSYYLNSLRIAESSNDEKRVATVLQNIGAVYEETEDYDKSQEYLIRALEKCEELNYDKGIATSSLNLGENYFNRKNYTKAKEYYQLAKETFEKISDPSLPQALIKLGKIDIVEGQYQKAVDDLTTAYNIAMANDGKVAMALAQNALGEVYVKQNLPQDAITAYTKAEEIGKSLGTNDDLRESYEGLSISNRMIGDYRNALRFQDSLLKVEKELYNIEKDKKLSNLQLAFDIEKKESEIAILNADNEVKTLQIARANTFRNFSMAAAAFLLILVGGIAYQYRFARKTNKIITKERNKSDQLLLNILPEETAAELKLNGHVKAKRYDFATVLFTDFVGFTKMAEGIPPEELVESIDYYFRNFDKIIEKYNLEKIKTIGDAYMCAGGVPKENRSNALDAIKAANEIIDFVERTAADPPPHVTPFSIRIGINCGPIVAGVVGTTKFQYDIWGDTVNVASRMETNSEPNQVNVSENIYDILKDEIDFSYRGEINVKNRGKMKMYYLDRFSHN